MENAATMGTLLHEMGLVLQGLIDSGYSEQFERIIFKLLRTSTLTSQRIKISSLFLSKMEF